MCRAGHSSRGVLSNAVCRVWSRNLMNVEVIAHVGPERHKKNSIVDTVWAGRRGFGILVAAKLFLLYETSISTLGATQSRGPARRVKRAGSESVHTHPFSAQVKN